MRWIRRAFLALVVTTVIALIWFNRIGLPDFIKNPLTEKLRAHGVGLELSRVRLRVDRGLVAENVRIDALNLPDGPHLTLAEAQLLPDFSALLHGQLQVRGLVLRQGRLIWPLSPTNFVSLDNIQTDLRFGDNDTWSLDNFKADFARSRLALAGDIVHARELRDWDIFHVQKSGGHEWRENLAQFYRALARAQYEPRPQLTLLINGDARNPRSFIVNLAIAQGHTRLELNGKGDYAADDYRWRIHGSVEPGIIRPFLMTTNAVRGFNHFSFTEPLVVDASLYGSDFETFGANGSLALTNFAVRGETIDNVVSDFSYTNRVLDFYVPHLARGSQTMAADQVTLDFNSRLIWFKNGFSTADARAVGRAIGPKVGHLLDPYRFAQPPTVRVNGCIPLRNMDGSRDIDDADMTFEVIKGGEFQCLKLRAETITGTIHWKAQTLVLTNVLAQLYGGTGDGFAFFDFATDHEGGDYQCMAQISKVNLHLLAEDLASPKNKLEGQLSGKVVITHGDTRNLQALTGYGHANLHDGLLWDVPIFGVFSPLLNTLSPGVNLGNSRATDAGGSFTITDGVIYSDPLEIHSTAMVRLIYSGSVSVTGKVDATVTAQLLRDIPVFGPIIAWLTSPFTELFKYKVTGTLKDPKTFPLYVPKEAMHPIQSIEGNGSENRKPAPSPRQSTEDQPAQ
jgi:hypothetical protein